MRIVAVMSRVVCERFLVEEVMSLQWCGFTVTSTCVAPFVSVHYSPMFLRFPVLSLMILVCQQFGVLIHDQISVWPKVFLVSARFPLRDAQILSKCVAERPGMCCRDTLGGGIPCPARWPTADRRAEPLSQGSSGNCGGVPRGKALTAKEKACLCRPVDVRGVRGCCV